MNIFLSSLYSSTGISGIRVGSSMALVLAEFCCATKIRDFSHEFAKRVRLNTRRGPAPSSSSVKKVEIRSLKVDMLSAMFAKTISSVTP